MPTRWIRSYLLTTAAAIMAGAGGSAFAQSAIWDATLSNSNWYVPMPQLLAYAAPATGFSNPIPIGDQTLWRLGAASNGAFTGISSAQLAIGLAHHVENSTIQGFVTTAGQITMLHALRRANQSFRLSDSDRIVHARDQTLMLGSGPRFPRR